MQPDSGRGAAHQTPAARRGGLTSHLGPNSTAAEAPNMADDDDWDTEPDVDPHQKDHYRPGGAAAVANPFAKSMSSPAPAPAPAPSGVPIKRANSFTRFGGGGVKCVNCGKTVYAAERRDVGDKVYHKDCFRCSKEGCSKLLGQDFCVESTSRLCYCKPHFMQLKRPAQGSVAPTMARIGIRPWAVPPPAAAPALAPSPAPAPAPAAPAFQV